MAQPIVERMQNTPDRIAPFAKREMRLISPAAPLSFDLSSVSVHRYGDREMADLDGMPMNMYAEQRDHSGHGE